MNVTRPYTPIGIALLCALGLAACDSDPGAAERAGKAIDQGVQQAGRQLSTAVGQLETKVDEQSAKTNVTLDDSEITARVKASIFAEPGLKTLQISVDTVKGVVTLSGSVDTPADSDRASGLARAVAGVSAVDNRLAVKAK